jgi:hypothetical protein
MGRGKGKGCRICGDPIYAKGLCEKHYRLSQRRKQSVRIPRVIRIERRRK